MREPAITVPRDADRLRSALGPWPQPVARPVLVAVSGLPGSGKSYFSRGLVKEIPLLVLESDVLRRVLSPSPTYSGEESVRLFSACHDLIAALLGEGMPLLLDATNLLEGQREELYRVAEQAGAGLVLIALRAPPRVIRRRLEERSRGGDPEDHSTAGWEVYQRMERTREPLGRNHLEVDTSRDISPAMAMAVAEIDRAMGPGG